MRRPTAADHSADRGWAAARRALAGGGEAGSALFVGALLLELAAAIAGGASQANALSLMAVQLASLPLLFVGLYLALAGGAPRAARWPLLLLAAVVAVPLLQLLPLPADVWTRLPGREPAARIVAAVGLGRPMLPFSLAPTETWRALLALAPPAAMFVGVSMLGETQRRAMAALWLALALASLTLGAMQALRGADSALYLYAITNAGSPVGVFANRNHQAALLYALIPVAAAFAARWGGRVESRQALGVLLAALFVVLAIVGVAATRSRAGVVLAGAALVGATAVLLRGGTSRRDWRGAATLGVGALAAVGAVLAVAAGPIAARFGEGGEPRFTGWPLTLKAAANYLPLGSGIGSFQTVYGQIEPLEQVSPIYFNHAHNDYLELWLETGVAGAAVLAGFAVWLAWRLLAVWRRREGDALAAAASVTVLLLLAHSAVDYPLRTESLAVLFAFACACLIPPPPLVLTKTPAMSRGHGSTPR